VPTLATLGARVCTSAHAANGTPVKRRAGGNLIVLVRPSSTGAAAATSAAASKAVASARVMASPPTCERRAVAWTPDHMCEALMAPLLLA